MSSLRIVFVTGLSGAGLSQAIKSFEDLGFYCIEHLPPAVLDGAIEALERSQARDVAIALDMRSGAELETQARRSIASRKPTTRGCSF